MIHKIEDLIQVMDLLFGKYEYLSKIEKLYYKEIVSLIDRYYDTFFLCLKQGGKMPPFRLKESDAVSYPIYTYNDRRCIIDQPREKVLSITFSYNIEHDKLTDSYIFEEKTKVIQHKRENGDVLDTKTITYFNNIIDPNIHIDVNGEIKKYSINSFNLHIFGLENIICNLEMGDFIRQKKLIDSKKNK